MYCIYRTTNLITGESYIGQHKIKGSYDYLYIGSGILLREALKIYGRKNFKREIIIYGDFTRSQLNKFEKCMIYFERLNGKAEYNIANGGVGDVGVPWNKGVEATDEHKRKVSEALKGRKFSEEHKSKIGKSNKNPSSSTRKKMSENNISRKLSIEYKKYKENGGTLKWGEFQKEYKKHNKMNA